MAYKLAENFGDSISVPQLIITRLKDLEDDWLRVALFIVATKNTDCSFIARELRLKGPDKAKEALLFWKGAGLLCEDETPEALDDKPVTFVREAKLTTREIAIAAQNNVGIMHLAQESQRIFGKVLNETDSNEILSLHLVYELPIDMILMGISHFKELGKLSGKYIARAMLNWQQQGIVDSDLLEKHLIALETRAKYEKDVAVLFENENAKFTKQESALITEWFEGFGYDCSMIAEAISYAGDKNTVKYVNGILRTWYSKGYKNAKDVQINSTNTMKNIQPLGTAPKKDILQNGFGKVPVYKKQGDNL